MKIVNTKNNRSDFGEESVEILSFPEYLDLAENEIDNLTNNHTLPSFIYNFDLFWKENLIFGFPCSSTREDLSIDVLISYPTSNAAYPTSNAKSLACDTANEQNALERHAAAVRQLSNGTNGDDLYIHIATVGNTIQTVNSPMYDTHMSTPGNTAKLRAIARQQHTDSTK